VPSRREQITMSDEELEAFLADERVVTVATIGPNGRPHLMPLWFVPDGTVLEGWTFARSQKAKNLERDPHATLQVEAGESYEELRGVMFECDVALDHDTERITNVGVALFTRYGADEEPDAATREMVEKQAPKRVALRFTPTRTVTWDHRKLGGTY
jgi:PPOX class probable F420-dependent enzyme